jgi:UDP-N-acetylglucosamine 2-epimerase (non-hydrolysing)
MQDIVAAHNDVEIALTVHPNPNVQSVLQDTLGNSERIHLLPPQDYVPFVHLMKKATLILSDSGGIQEEAPALGKPVLVLRDHTERPEAIEAGTARLVGTDRGTITAEVARLLEDESAYAEMARATNPFGDGTASVKIVEHLASVLTKG